MLDTLRANRRAASHPVAPPPGAQGRELGPSRSKEGPDATSTNHNAPKEPSPPSGKGEGLRPGGGHFAGRGEGMRSFMLGAFAKHDSHPSRGPLSGKAGARGAPSAPPSGPRSHAGGVRAGGGEGERGGRGGGGGARAGWEGESWADEDEESRAAGFQLGDVSCREFRLADVIAATRRFSAKQVLGHGHFSMVYCGTTPEGQAYAFKRLKKVAEPGSADFEALRREVQTLSGLSHRGIVQLHGYCFTRSEQVLVYELAEGGTLHSALKGPQGKGCQLYLRQRVRIALSMARAVGYLHQQGVIHRDIKPGNILLMRAGPGQDVSAKVADFGLLKVLDPKMEYTMTALAGTFGYMDPVCMRSGKTSFTSDLYAVGIVILSLLTGRDPAVADPRDLMLLVEREGERRALQAQQQQERQRRRALKMLKRQQAAQREQQGGGEEGHGRGERCSEGEAHRHGSADPNPNQCSEQGRSGAMGASSDLPSMPSTGRLGAPLQGPQKEEGRAPPPSSVQWGVEIPKSNTSPAPGDSTAGAGYEPQSWSQVQSPGEQTQSQAWEVFPGARSARAPASGASRRVARPLSMLEELHAVGREEEGQGQGQGSEGGGREGDAGTQGAGQGNGRGPPAYPGDARGAPPAPSLMPLRKWCAQMLKFREHRHLADAFLRPLFDMDPPPPPAGQGRARQEGMGAWQLQQNLPNSLGSGEEDSPVPASLSSLPPAAQAPRLWSLQQLMQGRDDTGPVSQSGPIVLGQYPAKGRGAATLQTKSQENGGEAKPAGRESATRPRGPVTGPLLVECTQGAAAGVGAGAGVGTGAGVAGAGWGGGRVGPGAEARAIEECVDLAVRLTDDDAKYRPTIREATESLRLVLDSIPSVCGPHYQELAPGVVRAIVGEDAWDHLAVAAAPALPGATAPQGQGGAPRDDPMGSTRGEVCEGGSVQAQGSASGQGLILGGRDPWGGEAVLVEWRPPGGGVAAHQGHPSAAARAVLQLAAGLSHRSLLPLAAACVADWRGDFLVYPVPREGLVCLEERLSGAPPGGPGHSLGAEAAPGEKPGAHPHGITPLGVSANGCSQSLSTKLKLLQGSPESSSPSPPPPAGPCGAPAPAVSAGAGAGRGGAPGAQHAGTGRKQRTASQDFVGDHWRVPSVELGPEFQLSAGGDSQSLRERVGVALGVAEAVHHLHANGLWHGALGPSRVFLRPGGGAPLLLGIGHLIPGRSRSGNASWRMDPSSQGNEPPQGSSRCAAECAPSAGSDREKRGEEGKEQEGEEEGMGEGHGMGMEMPKSMSLTSLQDKQQLSLQAAGSETPGTPLGHQPAQGPASSSSPSPDHPYPPSPHAPSFARSQSATGTADAGGPHPQASVLGATVLGAHTPSGRLKHLEPICEGSPRGVAPAHRGDASSALQPPCMAGEQPITTSSTCSIDSSFSSSTSTGSSSSSTFSSSLDNSSSSRQQDEATALGDRGAKPGAASESLSGASKPPLPGFEGKEGARGGPGVGERPTALTQAPGAAGSGAELSGSGAGAGTGAGTGSTAAGAGAGAGEGTGVGEEGDEGQGWMRLGSLRGASRRYTDTHQLQDVPQLEDVRALGALMLRIATGRGPVVESPLDLAFVERTPPPQRMSLHAWVACLIDQGQTHVLLGAPVHPGQAPQGATLALTHKQRSRGGAQEEGGAGGGPGAGGGGGGGVGEREGRDRHSLEAVLALSLQCLKADPSARPDSREVVSRLRAILGSLEALSPERERQAQGPRPSRLKGALIRQHAGKR